MKEVLDMEKPYDVSFEIAGPHGDVDKTGHGSDTDQLSRAAMVCRKRTIWIDITFEECIHHPYNRGNLRSDRLP